jgi:hypothetical protein
VAELPLKGNTLHCTKNGLAAAFNQKVIFVPAYVMND